MITAVTSETWTDSPHGQSTLVTGGMIQDAALPLTVDLLVGEGLPMELARGLDKPHRVQPRHGPHEASLGGALLQ